MCAKNRRCSTKCSAPLGTNAFSSLLQLSITVSWGYYVNLQKKSRGTDVAGQ